MAPTVIAVAGNDSDDGAPLVPDGALLAEELFDDVLLAPGSEDADGCSDVVLELELDPADDDAPVELHAAVRDAARIIAAKHAWRRRDRNFISFLSAEVIGVGLRDR